MGGSGSGPCGYYGKKDTVEQCRNLDIGDIRRKGFLQPGQTCSGTCRWTNPQGEDVASLGYTATGDAIRLYYTIRWRDREPEQINYEVPVVWTPCNFGGERPWFVCPGSRCGGRRVAKLYHPPGGARYYLCRHCYDLTYYSRQTWDKQLAFYRRHPEALDRDLQACNKFGTMILSRAIGARVRAQRELFECLAAGRKPPKRLRWCV